MKVATLGYLRNQDSTLMMHRIKKKNDMHRGKWNGLGGKLKNGETPEECLLREFKEESGLEIISPILKGIITFPKFDGFHDWLVFVFIANQYEGKLIDCNEGNLEWIPNEKIFDLNLWEGDRIFMKWLNDSPFFSAKFVYEKGELEKYNVNFY